MYFPSFRKKKVPIEPVALENPIPQGTPQSDISTYFPSMSQATVGRDLGVQERGIERSEAGAPSPYFPAIDTPEGATEGQVAEAGAPKTLQEQVGDAYLCYNFQPIDAALSDLSKVLDF